MPVPLVVPDQILHTVYSNENGFYTLLVTFKGWFSIDPYITIKHSCGAGGFGCGKRRYTHYFTRDDVTVDAEPKYNVHSVDLLSEHSVCNW